MLQFQKNLNQLKAESYNKSFKQNNTQTIIEFYDLKLIEIKSQEETNYHALI